MLEVMQILEASTHGGRQLEFMSTHPNPGNRKEVIREAIAKRFPNGVPNNLTTGRSLQAHAAQR